MAADAIHPWRPDWTVRPGEVLLEALADRGISQSELARRMARPQKTVNEIANGKAAITPETAIQLERALGITADLWLGLETRYRADLARTISDLELEGFGEWAKGFPLKELRAHDLISVDSGSGAAADLLRFFGVSSPAGWAQHWGNIAASYRMSGAANVSQESISAWLRWAEIEADRLEVSDFDAPGLIEVLRESRTLTRKAIFSQALEDLQARLARVGVAMVVLPSPPKAPASGAARWHRGRGLVTLSLRFLSDDQLWHSVYHEMGHLVHDRRGKSVIEEIGPELTDTDEAAADKFARDLLIPAAGWATFISAQSFTRRDIERFAKEQGIATGIVVGRLQHDHLLLPSQLKGLKRRLEPITPVARD
jgi:HTH-type transcriptional regulator / antitoxin HigA